MVEFSVVLFIRRVNEKMNLIEVIDYIKECSIITEYMAWIFGFYDIYKQALKILKRIFMVFIPKMRKIDMKWLESNT